MPGIRVFSRTPRAALWLAPLAAAMLWVQMSGRVQAQTAAAQKPSKSVAAQATPAAPLAQHGATAAAASQPTLYIVGYAHLDTEWRWEYPQVISEYLSKTMRNNFALFQKYPHYIFNFTGANRYMMMKEYFPADFARLKQYVAEGRWFPAGSSMEENDVNSPAAESILRQVLYGNEFYRHEFGKASEEYMLPDCFGFPASLPSILAHAGIRGFSTQKLSSGWQPAARVGGPNSVEQTPEGIPFNVGVWEGPDGKTIIAALNPEGYGSDVYTDLSKNNAPPPGAESSGYTFNWPARVDLDGKVTGVFKDYHYVGTGDVGGSPNEFTVNLMEAIESKSMAVLPPFPVSRRNRFQMEQAPPPGLPVRVGDGRLRVTWSAADQMFKDIAPGETSRMPRYKGDLELINHSAGSITSQAYQKRWNRENELLAGAAEEASVGASLLGGRAYPQERLNHAWRLVLGGEFHDIMAGTATPKSYNYAWNDDVIAMNQFAGVITSATEAIASGMNTQGPGTPIVVYNPLSIAREDVVEANIAFPNGVPRGVRVSGPDGNAVPAQVEAGENGAAKVLFLVKAPSVGFAVYDVQAADSAAAPEGLSVSESSLENARYRIQLDKDGDISSLFDKKLNRELLSAPIRLAIITDNPEHWPAWNMDFEDEQRAPRTFVGGPAQIRVVERGPVRVAIEVSRQAEDSKFVQTIRLSAGDAGNRVEFVNAIDWHARAANLKATFPLAASNRLATYNWDIGTIQRPNEDERQFEVASHQWIDLTDQSGSFGVTILTDDKNASDKPNDNTLRLTLMRAPGTRGGYADQGSQDWGHHEFIFGLAGHDGDWRKGETNWQAERLNQPLLAFESSKHTGELGKSFSLLKTSSGHVRVLALKKAEASDEVIVRAVELEGQTEPNVHFHFAAPVLSAREVNGQEQPVGPATVEQGDLVTSFTTYQPRTFAVKLGAPPAKAAAPSWRAVELPYDTAVASPDGKPAEGCFDCMPNEQDASQGEALPAEMLPTDIAFQGVHFRLVAAGTGRPDAVAAKGEKIRLPAGNFNHVYILAAAMGDQKGTFRVGETPTDLTVENWSGFIGQWDNRRWTEKDEQVPIRRPAGAPPLPPGAPAFRTVHTMEFTGEITPGFIKRADVAWFASHIHDAGGENVPYTYSYLFAYRLDVPAGAKTLALPNDERIRVLAVTVADEPHSISPAHPLYDTLERQK